MKKLLLTGGGTAGHVTPNIAMLPLLRKKGYDVAYIGSYNGIEKKLITEQNVPYYGIATGKLRRYFDLKNFTDPFRVIKGCFEAKKLIKKLKPDVVFSKGGFVSVPVVLAAHRQHIPVIIHESDMTPGLANKICIPYASKVCCNFPETVAMIPDGKGVLTGTPIRAELSKGDRQTGLDLCHFTSNKPVIMVIGGSLGAQHVNEAVRSILPSLLEKFQIVHLCGKGKVDESFYSLNKPNLLIPLPAGASRGDQILNAESFKKQGFSMVLSEDEMTNESLYLSICELYEKRAQYIDCMKKSAGNDSINQIVSLISEASL